MDLKANTAVDVLIGPFVDKTDGNSPEAGLTLTAAEIKLSKNGQALTLKSDVTSAAADGSEGYYNCELDVTDTNTEGNLVLIVHQSANALPVRHEFNVLSEAAWDSLYAAKDTGFMSVNVTAMNDVSASAVTTVKAVQGIAVDGVITTLTNLPAITANWLTAAGTHADFTTEIQAGLATPTNITAGTITTVTTLTGHTAQTGDTYALANGVTGFAAIDTVVDAILVDTATTIPATIATVDSNVDAILVDTGTTIPATIATVDSNVDAILVDTAEIGTAGAGLTNINLPNQTMDITGNITGNLSGSIGSNTELGPTEVNAEVVDALATDTYAEPGIGAPGATVSLAAKIGYLYKFLRNKKTETATTFSVFNDDTTTVDHQSTVSDDGTTATKTEVISG